VANKNEEDINIEDKDLDDQEKGDVTKKKGLSKIIKIIIAVILALLIAGGLVGGTLYYANSTNADQSVSKKKTDDAAATEDGDETDDDVDEEDDDEDEDEDEDVDEEEEDEDEDEDEAEGKELLPAQYYSMDPKFVVSFSNQKFARFMQFSLEIMSRDAEVIKKIEQHNPVIRSSLLMLFGSQAYADMASREGY